MSESTLPKQYRPDEHEPRIWDRWVQARAFEADPKRVLEGQAQPYCILMPPPNVTAPLHLGHALNNTIQDILIRAHRMMGFEALWIPGADHAGIATQTVVDKRLQAEGKPALADYKKMELAGENGRERFIALVQAWKDEYSETIKRQSEAMGAGADWRRYRFTMDDICARAVREAFFRLFRDGLIYRGKRLVNWDPVTQTALADDEVENVEIDGAFYYLRYPLVHQTEPGDHRPVTWSELATRGYPEAENHPGDEQAWITVATTRPETYLGDTGVAVNPKDPRAKAVRGFMCELPIVGRVIPIVEDDYVVLPVKYGGEEGDAKAEMSTGFLKVTPAHDPNDEQIGKRHDLRVINVMAPDASISDQHGWEDVGDAGKFIGLSREDARKLVIEEFKARSVAEGVEGSLLEKIVPHRHSVGHSYRSHVPIEPYLSDQWYCKVTDDKLRGSAQRAMAPSQRTNASLDAWPESEPKVGGAGVPPAANPSASSVPGTLTRARRRLPHWQMGGSTYFVTFRLASGELTASERQLVLDACFFHSDRAATRLATVMPDHVHVLLTPRPLGDGWHSLSDLLHSIKGYTAHEINKRRGVTGQVWQDESFDRIIRDEDEFREKWAYMQNNPVKAGLCATPEEYPFTRRGDVPDGRRDACPTDGTMTFHPERYAKTYETWHDNLRDWCISRQLWWGHRIPVWHIKPLDGNSDGVPSPFEDLRGYESGAEQFLADLAAKRSCKSDFKVRADDPVHLYVSASTEAGAELLRLLTQLVDRSSMYQSPGQEGPPPINRPDLFPNQDNQTSILLMKARHWFPGLSEDPDVLDTWFSSALWPLSTMGWPEAATAHDLDPESPDDFAALLPAFNPTSVLTTAREIITLWVSRMVMFNRYFLGQDNPEAGGAGVPPASLGPQAAGEPGRRDACPTISTDQVPFHDVFIHAMIQDGEGRKMSKSLGNGVDPFDIIASHGADAMRFTLAKMTTQTQDVRMPVVKDEITGKNTSPKFDEGRNFCNKLWNAARFTLSMLDKSPPDIGRTFTPSELSLADRWMLSRLESGVREIEDAIGNYQFSAYAQSVYDLLWRDFCDWYLEAIKPQVESDGGTRATLRFALDAILRLLHPVTPFVTEAVHEHLREAPMAEIRGAGFARTTSTDTLCQSGWPELESSVRDEGAEAEFEWVRSLVRSINETRAAHKVEPRRKITLHAPGALAERVEGVSDLVRTLAGLETITSEASEEGAVFTYESSEWRLTNLADAVDADAERERLTKRKDELARSIGGLNGRLSNPGYTEKAPAHLVQQTRDELASLQEELAAVERALDGLG